MASFNYDPNSKCNLFNCSVTSTIPQDSITHTSAKLPSSLYYLGDSIINDDEPPTNNYTNLYDSHMTSSTAQQSDIELFRKWNTPIITTNSKYQIVANFSIMSYNLLADSLLFNHTELYINSNMEYKKWSYRREGLLHEILQHEPDILCLQEIEEYHFYTFFLPEFSRYGYIGKFIKKTGHYIDGCSIFFKCDQFRLEEYRPVEFLHGVKILNRDNVGIIMKFRLIAQKSQSKYSLHYLYVVCTHLIFNPKAGDVKLAQLLLLFSELYELTNKDKEPFPILFCADLNARPNSALYFFVLNGYLNYKYLCHHEVCGISGPRNNFMSSPLIPTSIGITNACKKFRDIYVSSRRQPITDNDGSHNTRENIHILSHPFSFMSAYPHSLTSVQTVSNYHNAACDNVDYIFYSSPIFLENSSNTFVSSRYLRLNSYYILPTVSEAKTCQPLPNQYHSSDHLPLIAKFSYIV